MKFAMFELLSEQKCWFWFGELNFIREIKLKKQHVVFEQKWVYAIHYGTLYLYKQFVEKLYFLSNQILHPSKQTKSEDN